MSIEPFSQARTEHEDVEDRCPYMLRALVHDAQTHAWSTIIMKSPILHIRQCLICGSITKSACKNKFVFCSMKCRNQFTEFVGKLPAQERHSMLEKLNCYLCETGGH